MDGGRGRCCRALRVDDEASDAEVVRDDDVIFLSDDERNFASRPWRACRSSERDGTLRDVCWDSESFLYHAGVDQEGEDGDGDQVVPEVSFVMEHVVHKLGVFFQSFDLRMQGLMDRKDEKEREKEKGISSYITQLLLDVVAM